MSSTYSTDLRIELIGTGDQAGVWGVTTNNTLGSLMEAAIAGYTSVSITASPQALTAYDGAADESRYNSITLTTTTGADFTVCIPPSPKLYTFYNASAHAATITNATALNGTTPTGGSTLVVPAGRVISLWTDGTNVVQKTDYFYQPVLVTPVLTNPDIGTPTAGILANCTDLPLASVTGFGTGVGAALAQPVGTAGAPVVQNGSLGTPSSGVLTNCTGTAAGLSIGGNAGTANSAAQLNTGNFSVVQSGTKLYFKYGTTNIASIDSSGNIVMLANVTGFGTP